MVEWLLGVPRGSVLKQLHGPTRFRPITWHRFHIEWPEPLEPGVRWRSTGHPFAAALHRALGELRLGTAYVVGGGETCSPDGPVISRHTSIAIRVRGDFDRGLRVVREVIRGSNPPAGVTLALAGPERRAIPWQADGP